MSFPEIVQIGWPVVAAYVIGATPFGYLAGRLRGLDIREHGSGNIGATNVFRVLGKPLGITVLTLDVLKGLIPVLIAKAANDNSLIHIFSAIGAILGHNYTFWLKFRGGKGIATSAGALAPILPIPLVVGMLAWFVLHQTLRWVSVASIGAALALPITVAIQSLFFNKPWDWPVLGFAAFLAIMAIWRHRSNIGRLMKGEEPKTPRKSKPAKD